jgi:Fic family protein
MPWIWQHPAWPDFRWDAEQLLRPVAELGVQRGRLLTELSNVGLSERAALTAEALTEDALGTSLIEGEQLPPASVRSSVARHLGLAEGGLAPTSRDVEGVVEVLLDATRAPCEALDEERLFGWHAAIFPTGRSGLRRIRVGAWRESEVLVSSGPVGSERVHFRAPPAARVPVEMAALLSWWNGSSRALEGVLRAGVAHLWFETIHPFDDGNGRLGRALADMALAAADGTERRSYSLSSQILSERGAYYQALQQAQQGGPDITPWLTWFVGCVARSVTQARRRVSGTLVRARILARARDVGLNHRQIKALSRMAEAGSAGFEGGMTNRKYRALTRSSAATATRDLAELEAEGFLQRGEAGGRSVHYQLVWREGGDE